MKFLKEKLPLDLAKAYNRSSRYAARTTPYLYKFDYENANYEEITPERAIQLRKLGRIQDLRFIIDSHLVMYDEYGKCIESTEVSQWTKDSKAYTTRTGNVITDTRYMPFNYVCKIADKIYVTDEFDTKIDPKKATRRETTSDYMFQGGSDENNYWGNRHYGSEPRATGAFDTGRHKDSYSSSFLYKSYLRSANRWKEKLNKLEQAYKAGDISNNDYNSIKADYEHHYRDDMNDAYRTKPTRSIDELETAYLQRNINKYKALKQTLKTTSDDIESEINRLDDLSSKASNASQYYSTQSKLERLRAELKRLQQEIAEYEARLSDEQINKDIDASRTELSRLNRRHAEAQNELNKLLRKDTNEEE